MRTLTRGPYTVSAIKGVDCIVWRKVIDMALIGLNKWVNWVNVKIENEKLPVDHKLTEDFSKHSFIYGHRISPSDLKQ